MRGFYTKKLSQKIEGKKYLSDSFHVATYNKKINLIGVGVGSIPQSWIKIHFKAYPRLKRISLEKVNHSKKKLSYLLKKRRSSRAFSGKSISKSELSYLLTASCGLINFGEAVDETRRAYPSAGARYPLEVYPFIIHCDQIKRGLYHYNVKANTMEELAIGNFNNDLVEISGGEEWITKTAVIFVITAVFDRTRVKYGDRGYRYALIEAGHLGQNICLLATELGLKSCPIGGFIDTKLNKLLDIDKTNESALYLIAVG